MSAFDGTQPTFRQSPPSRVPLDQRDLRAEPGAARGRRRARPCRRRRRPGCSARRAWGSSGRGGCTCASSVRSCVVVGRGRAGRSGVRRPRPTAGGAGAAGRGRRFVERAPRDPGHDDRHEHRRREADEVEHLLRACRSTARPRRARHVRDERAQVHVQHGARASCRPASRPDVVAEATRASGRRRSSAG